MSVTHVPPVANAFTKPELISIFLDYKESLSLQDKQTTSLTSPVTVLYPHMTFSCHADEFSKVALVVKSRGGAFFILSVLKMGTG